MTTTWKNIELNPEIMFGKPVFRGTRITVQSVREKLASGESIQQVLDAHPRLSRQDIEDAYEFNDRFMVGDYCVLKVGDYCVLKK